MPVSNSINNTRYTVDMIQPSGPAPEAVTTTVRLPGLINWARGQVLGIVTGTAASAVHRLTFGGTVTGGTFRLVYGNDLTGPITWSGTAATLVANVQAAMDLLVGVGECVVSGTGPYDITFQNGLLNRAIPAPTLITALTGTSPTLAASLQTAGHPGGGLAGVYDDALSTGVEVARCVLKQATQTNLRGEVIADRPGSTLTAVVYVAGPFFTADLVGLDANGVADLGRLINAPTIATAGAIIHIR